MKTVYDELLKNVNASQTSNCNLVDNDTKIEGKNPDHDNYITADNFKKFLGSKITWKINKQN